MAARNRVLAAYRGGADLVVGNGKPIISGDQIIAGTVGASQLVAGQAVITEGAQIADAIITSAKITDLEAQKLIAGTITASEIYLTDPKFELDGAAQRIVVKDNQVPAVTRVIFGKIGTGDTDFGIQIFNETGDLILSSGSPIGTHWEDVIGGPEALAPVSAAAAAAQSTADTAVGNAAAAALTSTWAGVTGSGKPTDNADKTSLNTAYDTARVGGDLAAAVVRAGNKITGANIATYMSSAAIGDAYINNLAASKILAGTVSVQLALGVAGKILLDGANNRIIISD
ncbi:MAG: hypothetical protein GC184_06025 [Rhizobiales bacterium]|nr:hypothetical protein [Hyphomicrobiales bacterium]